MACESDLVEVETVLGVGGGHARLDAQHGLVGSAPHRFRYLGDGDLMLGRVGTGGVEVGREAAGPADVAQHETALEAELAGELIGEMRSDRHQREVALDQFDRPVQLFGELL